MQKENSLFCLVLGLFPISLQIEYLLVMTSVNLLGYGTNRARWECVSLSELT
jgi:hypothetical protein